MQEPIIVPEMHLMIIQIKHRSLNGQLRHYWGVDNLTTYVLLRCPHLYIHRATVWERKASAKVWRVPITTTA